MNVDRPRDTGLAEFDDPRLVAAYETLNPYEPGTQLDFYVALADELEAATIVDLGCGTGLITRELARRGHRMIGVDPSAGLLAIARGRPDGHHVQWLHGGAGDLGRPGADLAIMTGHVAQFFLTDDAWQRALGGLFAALRPGGALAFETRNPAAREWETWTPDARTTVTDPVAGPIETWIDGVVAVDDIVRYDIHHRFLATGEDVVAASELRFRTADEVTDDLRRAGFRLDRAYGDWDRRPAGPMTRELIVVATRLEAVAR